MGIQKLSLSGTGVSSVYNLVGFTVSGAVGFVKQL